MPTYPAFKTKPYYDALKTWLTTALNDDGTLKSSAVQAEVSAAIAAEPTVVDAAAAAVDANPTIAYTNPGEVGTSGKALIQGPSSPTWGDMETVVFDHVFERSATPATNRANLQTLLDRVAPVGSGKQVRLFIPPKFDGSGNPDPIVVDRSSSGGWCIDVPSNVAIEGAGAGSTIKLDAAQPNFTRILHIQDESQVTIRRLRLDGNTASATPTYEQNHNIMIFRSSDVRVEDVVSINATGDDVYVGGDASAISERVWIERSIFTGATRNPISVCDASDVYVLHNYIVGTPGGEAIDSEPNHQPTWGLTVIGNVISHPQFALSTFGTQNYPRVGTRFLGNHIVSGGIYMVHSRDVVIAHNTGTITQIIGNHDNENITITDNVWNGTVDGTSRDYMVTFQEGSYGVPSGITVARNTFTSSTAGGVQVWSGDRVRVSGNTLLSTVRNVAIHMRPVAASMNAVVISDNIIDTALRGINFQAYSPNVFRDVTVTGNTIRNTSSYAIDLDVAVFERLHIEGNTLASGGMRGTNQAYTIGGQAGLRGIWSVNGTPEGVITDSIGAVAYRRDGGAGTTMYVKESGTGNTGWIAK